MILNMLKNYFVLIDNSSPNQISMKKVPPIVGAPINVITGEIDFKNITCDNVGLKELDEDWEWGEFILKPLEE